MPLSTLYLNLIGKNKQNMPMTPKDPCNVAKSENAKIRHESYGNNMLWPMCITLDYIIPVVE